jgi:glycosyltransferase involved in cell wall biosynthesis
MSLTVTALIPAFNRERFIRAAIESVLRQDRPVDEIIVVDDGSSDGTAGVSASFREVRLIRRSTNAGTAIARNAGVAAARGDLIAWLDSDDLWLPHHCSTVVPLLETYPAAVVGFGGVEFTGERNGIWPVLEFPSELPFDAFLQSFERNVPPMMATVTRRASLLEIGGFDESMACSVDFDLFLRLSRLGPFICSHTVTAQYRWHGEQLSARPLAQLQAIYFSRHKMLRALTASGEEGQARVLRQRLLEFLQKDLWIAWAKRDLVRVRALLKVAEPFEGARTVTGRFRYRQHAPQLLMTAWDKLQRTEPNS